MIKIHCPIQFCNLPFFCLFSVMRGSELLGCSLSFQISGGIVEALVKSFSAWVLRLLNQQNQSCSDGGKNCKLVIRCDEGEEM